MELWLHALIFRATCPIALLRHEHGETADQLAAGIGVHPRIVERWERNVRPCSDRCVLLVGMRYGVNPLVLHHELLIWRLGDWRGRVEKGEDREGRMEERMPRYRPSPGAWRYTPRLARALLAHGLGD